MNGLAFDLSTPHGRIMVTIIADIAEFERELIPERTRSWIATAKARGKRLGCHAEQKPKSDRPLPVTSPTGRPSRPPMGNADLLQPAARRHRPRSLIASFGQNSFHDSG